MATEAQILANQKNSKLSTGPRTDEGKARSRLNSVKHGLRADVPIMPWETKEAFLAFQNNLMYSLLPNDPMQAFITEMAILTAWRLKRASRLEMAYFCRRHQPAASSSEAAPPQAEACGYTERAEACGYTEGAASPPLGDPEPWEDPAILEEMQTFVESTRTSPLPRYEAHLNRQLNSYLAQLRLLKKDEAKADRTAYNPAPPSPPPLPPPIWEPEPVNKLTEFPPFLCVSEEGRQLEIEQMQKAHEHRLRCLADDAAALREHVGAEKEQREYSDENYENGYLANCKLLRIDPGSYKQNR